MERRMLVMQRDCPARLVPAGTRITITKDTFVTLTQDLGGTYTVNVNGNLARIDGTDADALGLEPLTFDFGEADGDGVDEANVWEALRTVYDPEIPVNVVDLGLIYDCRIEGHTVAIDMTLTSPGCGMGPVLLDDVKYRVAKVPNVEEVQVELVFDPPWGREMMSEEAQLELGVYG
ncbi:MAG: putative Fe-S cluster assembly protein SufT [Gammaproteobacteria bacterium]|jgi:probable FeS assembly SUF system protein SufT|nr:putative Fe-S cluster assembly protein SufT [Gammaproteobacteria bacterium]